MVLHLIEYMEYLEKLEHKNPKIEEVFNRYCETNWILHALTARELAKLMLRISKGSGTVALTRLKEVLDYFKWLELEYNIEVLDKGLEAEKLLKENIYRFVGFVNFEEFNSKLDEKIELIKNNTEKEFLPDCEVLKAVFYLQWLGIDIQYVLEMDNSDISTDGKMVKIPNSNKILKINNSIISNYLKKYITVDKRKTADGRKVKYVGTRIFRTTRTNEDVVLAYRCALLRFNEIAKDIRFTRKYIQESGILNIIYNKEIEENERRKTIGDIKPDLEKIEWFAGKQGKHKAYKIARTYKNYKEKRLKKTI